MARAEATPTRNGGPGNRPIVAMLRETLVRRGRLADRQRASKWIVDAVGDESALPLWIDSSLITQLWLLPSVDAALARSIGHQLVSPDAVGMPLYALGLATPEKAYRRVHGLLPREAKAARWSADEIAGESAELSYEPGSKEGSNPRALLAGCAVRRGMLESIPTLYGLLPAQVVETACLGRGDSACRYRVRWSRDGRRGLILGSCAGSIAGVLFAATGVVLGLVAPGPAVFFAALVSLLGTAIGRGIDLAAQLEAVAGARRGQLALFDQVDDQLASKLDALARVDAKLEEEPAAFRVGLRGGPQNEDARAGAESATRMTEALASVFALAGDLECWFEQLRAPRNDTERRRREAARQNLRELRATARTTSREWSAGKGGADLSLLVSRAVASLRPTLPDPDQVEIELDLDEDIAPFECDAVQMEELLMGLVRNAVEASRAVGARPHARVAVRDSPGAVEIAVVDLGAGIESTEVDETFDPFFEEGTVGASNGMGLSESLRIVEAHGGEFRIESGGRVGTRVSTLLPRAHRAKPSAAQSSGEIG